MRAYGIIECEKKFKKKKKKENCNCSFIYFQTQQSRMIFNSNTYQRCTLSSDSYVDETSRCASIDNKHHIGVCVVRRRCFLRLISLQHRYYAGVTRLKQKYSRKSLFFSSLILKTKLTNKPCVNVD